MSAPQRHIGLFPVILLLTFAQPAWSEDARHRRNRVVAWYRPNPWNNFLPNARESGQVSVAARASAAVAVSGPCLKVPSTSGFAARHRRRKPNPPREPYSVRCCRTPFVLAVSRDGRRRAAVLAIRYRGHLRPQDHRVAGSHTDPLGTAAPSVKRTPDADRQFFRKSGRYWIARSAGARCDHRSCADSDGPGSHERRRTDGRQPRDLDLGRDPLGEAISSILDHQRCGAVNGNAERRNLFHGDHAL